MQSSTTVACRAGVMLVCLIAIPLAALFGTRLPDLVEDLLSRLPDLRGLRAGSSFPGTADRRAYGRQREICLLKSLFWTQDIQQIF